MKQWILILVLATALTYPACAHRTPGEKSGLDARSLEIQERIVEQWDGKPCSSPFLIDFDTDGTADFCFIFIDDPATSRPLDALGVHFFNGCLWAFIEIHGEAYEIIWIDPRAPDEWREWVEQTFSATDPGSGSLNFIKGGD
jgi:hypothetical protein